MENYPDDKKSGDVVYATLRALISSVPVAGGAVSVLFENIFSTPLDRRKEAWLKELASVVNDLESRMDRFSVDTLRNNKMFVTAALQASSIALRTHQEQKLNALRNAVFNSALLSSPEETIQLVFLSLIDRFSAAHIGWLLHFDDPMHGIPESELKELHGRGGLSRAMDETDKYIIADLQSAGLLEPEPDSSSPIGFARVDGNGEERYSDVVLDLGKFKKPRTTSFGKQFIKYITNKET